MDANTTAPTGAAAIQYEIDGHLYTTFAIAVLAGWTIGRALAVAWGSQLPDATCKFTATRAAWTALWWERSESIMKTLHSLHGGGTTAVLKRQQDIKSLLEDSLQRSDPDWKVGLMVHAYGDSYAHTYDVDGASRAYGYVTGHLWHGHAPDKIKNFPEKYMGYTINLYQALGGKEDPARALQRIREILDSPQDNAEELKHYAAELGMNEGESTEMMERLLDQVTMADVVETMEEMERVFQGPGHPSRGKG